ncbi:MAG: hypothetical protein U0556_04015 [Dehalococcoidia bacterium]
MTGDRHGCNAYCQSPEHCDLVYVPPGKDAHYIDLVYWQTDAGRVTRAKRAREAPPLAQVPPDRRDSLGTTPVDPASGEPWLVWWVSTKVPDYADNKHQVGTAGDGSKSPFRC